MENLLMFLATSLVLRIPDTASPKFKRYLLPAAGCSALLVAGNKTLHSKKTADGDRICFYNQQVNDVCYGMIVVHMAQSQSLPDAQKILNRYIDEIRQPLQIQFSGTMQLNDLNNSIELTDYWQDTNGVDWKIKGYANSEAIAVLYVRNIGSAPVDVHDQFLDGFRFSRFL